jgi:hypothetical protein
MWLKFVVTPGASDLCNPFWVYAIAPAIIPPPNPVTSGIETACILGEKYPTHYVSYDTDKSSPVFVATFVKKRAVYRPVDPHMPDETGKALPWSTDSNFIFAKVADKFYPVWKTKPFLTLGRGHLIGAELGFLRAY